MKEKLEGIRDELKSRIAQIERQEIETAPDPETDAERGGVIIGYEATVKLIEDALKEIEGNGNNN